MKALKQTMICLLVLGQIITGSQVNGVEIKKVDISSLPADGGEKHNRLIFEKSPYLLQHAENPIDWYPWGDGAFAKARKENKPIFLSIGYSTCHWCHVMAGESFDSKQVAEILNRNFIAIKVDREERPDIDAIYMRVCQMMTGGGGWPLTVLMTPERKPFFAGTYFPKESGYGRPGLIDILESTMELWRKNPGQLTESADKITGLLKEKSSSQAQKLPDRKILDGAYKQLAATYDSRYGGFGKAPKFPSPHQLMFLLRHWKRSGDQAALDMVTSTLEAFRRGGVYDQLGGGIHRYSTDREFLVPHFEKMLYDQALLAIAYLEAYQATGQDFFAATAREIFDYVLRDMTAPGGGFYSAEDADSEGEEGRFYLWSTDEVVKLLGPEEGARINNVFNLKKEGNYHDEVKGTLTGLNIPHLRERVDMAGVEKSTELLFKKRQQRIHPFKDDKIITSWNGLMIAALAMGGRILEDDSYKQAAERAADFVVTNLQDKESRLLRRYRDQEAAMAAYLDDYAFLVFGLMELYEATFRVAYLEKARKLNGEMVELFWDREHNAFNFSGHGNEKLLAQVRDFYDGALPSGNSIALLNLLKLSRLLDDKKLQETAETLAARMAEEAGEYPAGYAMFLSAVDFLNGPSGEIVVAGDPEAAETKKMLVIINRTFSPNQVVVLHPPQGKDIEKLAPYTEYQTMIDNRPTVYMCRNYACLKPVTEINSLNKMMESFP